MREQYEKFNINPLQKRTKYPNEFQNSSRYMHGQPSR